MAAYRNYFNNAYACCNYACGNSYSAPEMNMSAHALIMVCAFILALAAVINVVLSGIIICVLISVIIIKSGRYRAFNLQTD